MAQIKFFVFIYLIFSRFGSISKDTLSISFNPASINDDILSGLFVINLILLIFRTFRMLIAISYLLVSISNPNFYLLWWYLVSFLFSICVELIDNADSSIFLTTIYDYTSFQSYDFHCFIELLCTIIFSGTEWINGNTIWVNSGIRQRIEICDAIVNYNSRDVVFIFDVVLNRIILWLILLFTPLFFRFLIWLIL